MSLDVIYDAVIAGNAKVTAEETQAAIDAGISADDVLHKACIPAMQKVGDDFEAGEKFVPEMLIAARAMQAALNILKPLLAEESSSSLGKVVIGTVQGDLHDIGKNLVSIMLEGAGFEVVDLGSNANADKFINAIQENQPQIVGMSALLTTTMPAMTKTIEAIKAAGLREAVKIIIGGAPVTQDFADRIGADGYAADAGAAPRVAKRVLGLTA